MNVSSDYCWTRLVIYKKRSHALSTDPILNLSTLSFVQGYRESESEVSGSLGCE